MIKVIYEVVEHDGGWAYQVDGSYSETYPSHDAARRAAEAAAQEQMQPGADAGISFEDAGGQWHDEAVRGDDRPQTEVEG